jgi:glycosyltransferase involved in cell wall biosynthesis
MVILHLLAPGQAGGLERVVHSLAVGQQSRDHSVRVAAVVDAPGAAAMFFEPLVRGGVNVDRIVVPPRRYDLERRAVRALLTRNGPDVVHTHGYRVDVLDAPLIRDSGAANVATVHGFTRGPWLNRVYEHLHRKVLRRSDAVIAVSEPIGETLRAAGVSADRMHVVPNAFMQLAPPYTRALARERLGLDANAFVVGWVGRMVPEKGLDVLVTAMANLGDAGAVVCAIGDGSDRQAQRARAEQLGVGGQMRWPGLVPDASRYFPAFDAFVISSRTEGIPISLFEAMACGVPVVSTRVGGVPDVVTSEHAILVPSEDPSGIAAAIREVRGDPQRSSARSRAALQRLRADFGPDAWLSRHEAVYSAAMMRAAERRKV